ncbi:hypothetical protein [Tahibacter amnicola]|uniref:Uncharacterized protein n=1 Tax=Tahibacter amnicola TaxID=2976241 RepID=A0ABY6BD68_9GAMM|nr:hypothetical protein [Tahibacter amnicola]UXI66551.1 hypothetical protein N4264_17585 [Tahibacter amnicola]
MAMEPCDSTFLSAYYQGVDRLLNDAAPGAASLSITVLPAYAPEWGLRLVGNEVIRVRLDKSYWTEVAIQQMRHPDATVAVAPAFRPLAQRAVMDGDAVQRILDRYRRAIAAAVPSGRVETDSVTYRITSPQAGSARMWAPEDDTPEAYLAEVIRLLADRVELTTPKDLYNNQTQILSALRRSDVN